jgi:hypothetical protein
MSGEADEPDEVVEPPTGALTEPRLPLADAWFATVATVQDRGIRCCVVSQAASTHASLEVAEALELVCRLAEQAEPRARDVLDAWMTHLVDAENEAYWAEIRAIADRDRLLALGRLLRRRRTIHEANVRDPLERPPTALQGRSITLGERKALARGRDRFMLDRLLRDPHPAVIRNILSNPRVTEDDVIRLASRRPTFPDVQVEIARSPRFGHRPRVRLAIVQNPFSPTSLSVPLVPLLVKQDLASVVAGTELPAVVRAAAIELLQRRPPISSPSGSEPDPDLTQ